MVRKVLFATKPINNNSTLAAKQDPTYHITGHHTTPHHESWEHPRFPQPASPDIFPPNLRAPWFSVSLEIEHVSGIQPEEFYMETSAGPDPYWKHLWFLLRESSHVHFDPCPTSEGFSLQRRLPAPTASDEGWPSNVPRPNVNLLDQKGWLCQLDPTLNFYTTQRW